MQGKLNEAYSKYIDSLTNYHEVMKMKCRHKWAAHSMKCEKCGMTKLEYEESKKPVFNPRSSQQTVKVLQQLGFCLTKKTAKSKTFSTDDSVLFDLQGKHEFVDTLIKYREIYKQYSTYVCPLLHISERSLNTGLDSLIFPRFKQTSVSDERLSSADPNIQNITKNSEYGKTLRKCFIARPGHVLIANDYSQLHLRILAHYSRDPMMIDAYNTDKDLHQLTADMLNVVRSPVAKTINFGIVYSVGPKALAQQLHEQGHDISEKEASRIIQDFFEKYKGVKRWREYIMTYAQHYGYAPSIFGFRVPLPYITETKGGRLTPRAWHEQRKAVNSPILTTEAQIVKRSMQRIKKELGIDPIWQIHDDLTYEVQESCYGVAADKIRLLMEAENPLCVPLKVEQKIGKDWGSL